MHFIIIGNYKPKSIKSKNSCVALQEFFGGMDLFSNHELVVGDVHHIGGFGIDLTADDGTAQ